MANRGHSAIEQVSSDADTVHFERVTSGTNIPMNAKDAERLRQKKDVAQVGAQRRLAACTELRAIPQGAFVGFTYKRPEQSRSLSSETFKESASLEEEEEDF